MRIEHVEIDGDNVAHITSHGVTIAEIEAVVVSSPTVRRNKGGRTADDHAIANGLRVNVLYGRASRDRSAPLEAVT